MKTTTRWVNEYLSSKQNENGIIKNDNLGQGCQTHFHWGAH